MNEQNKLNLIALSCIDGVGDRTIAAAIEHYKSIENIFRDDEASISNVLKNAVSRNKNKIYNFKKTNILEKAEKIIENSYKRKIEILSVFDMDYPFNLKQIEHPPYILYIKGNKKVLRRNAVGIVGTRHPQKTSVQYAFDMGSMLSSLNITVVSGFAKGIDTAAHTGALTAKGNTIAVMGCGLDKIYPAENIKIFDEIAERGILMSEFYVGTEPDRTNFPRRNRIISGLSYSVVMVEASSKSGALITVDRALEQGRDVFIAPYDERKEAFYGNHKLFKEGAKIAENGTDIINEFDHIFSMDEEYICMRNKYFEGGSIRQSGIKEQKTFTKVKTESDILKKEKNIPISANDKDIYIDNDKKNDIKLNNEENIIYNIILKNKQIHIDDIAEKSKVSMDILLMTLMSLEIKGFVKQEPGKYFVAEK